jgi:hypothetical protein
MSTGFPLIFPGLFSFIFGRTGALNAKRRNGKYPPHKIFFVNSGNSLTSGKSMRSKIEKLRNYTAL